MGGRRGRGKLRPAEDFERLLAEEVSVSAEFGLPLALMVLVADGEWDSEPVERAVRTLRAADLISRTEPSVLAVALPNTGPEATRAVERRLLKTVPEARIGIAALRPGDAAQDLLDRARKAAGKP